MKVIKRLFCIHAWEYERDIDYELVLECRKCGKVKKLN